MRPLSYIVEFHSLHIKIQHDVKIVQALFSWIRWVDNHVGKQAHLR